MTKFPNYFEGSSGEEIDARIGAFIPLEFVYEKLNNGQENPTQVKLEGSRAEVSAKQLYTALSEIGSKDTWEFHSYADGTYGFVAETEDSYCRVHLLQAKNGTSRATVVIKGDNNQEFPDWFLTIDAGTENIRVECSKFDPYEVGIPEYDGSEFVFPPIPAEWLASED